MARVARPAVRMVAMISSAGMAVALAMTMVSIARVPMARVSMARVAVA